MSAPATLNRVKKAVEEVEFATEVIEANGSFSLVGYRVDLRVGFQAFWTKGKNQDTPGKGWNGALVRDPIGIPVELWGDYTPKAKGSKRPTQYQIERGLEMDALYNDGQSWLRKSLFVPDSNDFYHWVDDWRRLILKHNDFKPLARQPKPKADPMESGEWIG